GRLSPILTVIQSLVTRGATLRQQDQPLGSAKPEFAGSPLRTGCGVHGKRPGGDALKRGQVDKLHAAPGQGQQLSWQHDQTLGVAGQLDGIALQIAVQAPQTIATVRQVDTLALYSQAQQAATFETRLNITRLAQQQQLRAGQDQEAVAVGLQLAYVAAERPRGTGTDL